MDAKTWTRILLVTTNKPEKEGPDANTHIRESGEQQEFSEHKKRAKPKPSYFHSSPCE
jgi:hypothetical protein